MDSARTSPYVWEQRGVSWYIDVLKGDAFRIEEAKEQKKRE